MTQASGCIFSRPLLRQFIELTIQEVDAEMINLILAMANLPASLIEQQSLRTMDAAQAAETFASLQQALRMYYGRGARGLLLRIGRQLWDNMMEHASLTDKAQLQVARALPVPSRRKRVLEMVAGWMQMYKGSTSVHLLDIDLLVVDRGSATTQGQSHAEPICYVTLGLIQGALFWATGIEANVTEIACRAMGAPACEFKIKIGG